MRYRSIRGFGSERGTYSAPLITQAFGEALKHGHLDMKTLFGWDIYHILDQRGMLRIKNRRRWGKGHRDTFSLRLLGLGAIIYL